MSNFIPDVISDVKSDVTSYVMSNFMLISMLLPPGRINKETLFVLIEKILTVVHIEL